MKTTLTGSLAGSYGKSVCVLITGADQVAHL